MNITMEIPAVIRIRATAETAAVKWEGKRECIQTSLLLRHRQRADCSRQKSSTTRTQRRMSDLVSNFLRVLCGETRCFSYNFLAMNSKIAVVTGSSSGIGLRTTVEMAKAGYRVTATMRDVARRARLDEALSAELKNRIDVRRLDVTEFDTIPDVVNAIVRDHGRIDVLVNNAGFAVGGFAEDVTLEELRK